MGIVALVCYLISIVGMMAFAWIGFTSHLLSSRSYTPRSDTYSIATVTTMPLAPTQTPSVTKVGGTFVYDDLAVTLLSTKSIPGDKIVQPRPGNVFIVAHLKFHNLSTAPVEINEWDFLVIAAGNDYDDYYRSEQTPPASYMAANQLGWDRLQPGDIIYRDLILQAPIGAHGARLNWWPDIVHLEPDAYGWFLGL